MQRNHRFIGLGGGTNYLCLRVSLYCHSCCRQTARAGPNPRPLRGWGGGGLLASARPLPTLPQEVRVDDEQLREGPAQVAQLVRRRGRLRSQAAAPGARGHVPGCAGLKRWNAQMLDRTAPVQMHMRK